MRFSIAALPGSAANSLSVPAVVTDTVRAVIANPGMQRFLDREGHLALITGEHPIPNAPPG